MGRDVEIERRTYDVTFRCRCGFFLRMIETDEKVVCLCGREHRLVVEIGVVTKEAMAPGLPVAS